jgi:hypothetical protein
MPEWYVLVAVLGGLAALGIAWSPLLLITPIFALAVAASLMQAGLAAAKQPLGVYPWPRRVVLKLLIAWLYLIQPVARLLGRIRYGVGPWRRAGILNPPMRLRRSDDLWSEDWQSLDTRLAEIENLLLHKGAVVKRGGDFERWDLEIRGGLFGSVRALAMQEEHGAGKQLVRFRVWPQIPHPAIALFLALGLLTTLAAYHHAWLAAVILGIGALAVALAAQTDCAKAVTLWNQALIDYAPAEAQSAEDGQFHRLRLTHR